MLLHSLLCEGMREGGLGVNPGLGRCFVSGLPDLCRRFTTGYSVVPESSRGDAVDLSTADFSILEDVENVED